MRRSAKFLALFTTLLAGCAAYRPTQEWPDYGQSVNDDEDCEDVDESSSHDSFWRKLIPWDHKVDNRPYDERLQEFNNKFRNNG